MISIVQAGKYQNILDAGCGPGLTTKLLTHFAPNNSTIYSFDISDDMVRLCKSNFDDFNDFNANKDNYWEVFEPSPKDYDAIFDANELRTKYNKEGKIVRFFRANIEELPFKSEQFDLYFSSLCIMLCESAENAINEAYRVTKTGGIAVFSIWGDKSKSKYAFDLVPKALSKNDIKMQPRRSAYHLAEDMNKLKGFFESAGFKTPIVHSFDVYYSNLKEGDYAKTFMTPIVIKHIIDVYGQEKLDKVIADIGEMEKEIFLNNETPNLNCYILLARK